jgi:hypothetical protein
LSGSFARCGIEAVRVVDMSSSNAWAEFAAIFARTREAHLEHEQSKAELKKLMPEDVKEAVGPERPRVSTRKSSTVWQWTAHHTRQPVKTAA